MESNLAKVQPIDDKILADFLNMVGMYQLTEAEKINFIQISKAFNLNPFKREIHLVKYGTECNIIIGYESYIKRAESTGLLNGWRVWTKGDITPTKQKVKRKKKSKTGNGYEEYETEITVWTGDLKAFIEIKRKDWDAPFLHEVDFTEFACQKEIWAKSPKFMIKKVVIGQGFRLCFSADMAGLPYTQEEMDSINEKHETLESEAVVLNPKQTIALGLLDNSTLDKKSFEHIKEGILNSPDDVKKLDDAIKFLTTKQKKEPKKEPEVNQYKTPADVENAFSRGEISRESADEFIRTLSE